MRFLIGLLLGVLIGAMAIMIAWVRDEQQRSLHRLGMRNRNHPDQDPPA